MATREKSVLISGASIAGLTMAYWMNHYGFKVTVVEIGSEPRRGGSPIDVRGNALDSASRMGILDSVKKAKLSTKGLKFMNEQNQVQGLMLVEEIGAIRPGMIQNFAETILLIFYTKTPKIILPINSVTG